MGKVSATHAEFCLMLLGSPPDLVRHLLLAMAWSLYTINERKAPIAGGIVVIF